MNDRNIPGKSSLKKCVKKIHRNNLKERMASH
jgi:hypothetical protein